MVVLQQKTWLKKEVNPGQPFTIIVPFGSSGVGGPAAVGRCPPKL